MTIYSENIDRWAYGPANGILHEMLDQVTSALSADNSNRELSKEEKRELKAKKSFLVSLNTKKGVQEHAIFINRSSESKDVDNRFKQDNLGLYQIDWKQRVVKLRIISVVLLAFYLIALFLSFQFENKIISQTMLLVNTVLFVFIYFRYARKLWRCPACDYAYSQNGLGSLIVKSGVHKCPMCFVELKSNKPM